jgi:hypothetical protein
VRYRKRQLRGYRCRVGGVAFVGLPGGVFPVSGKSFGDQHALRMGTPGS